MKENSLQVSINTSKMVLSSKSLFYKTENFIKQSKYISNIDFLLSKLSEAVLLKLEDIVYAEKHEQSDLECFSIQTVDGQFSFLFKFGYQVGGLNDYDIIFFNVNNYKNAQIQTIEEYVRLSKILSARITKEKYLAKPHDFNRLYVLSNISNVNLPKLSSEQKEIVETIDKNILVQGVAGSGKTNICIDKIIFTACRNYSGKVLYTTFSRGLLADTKLKIDAYTKDLQEVLNCYNNNNVIYLDDNHKKALENRLGIFFFSDDDDQIILKLEKIINYLTNKVDYYLIEDLYKNRFGGDPNFVDENYFINVYSKNLSNYQIEKCFNKLANHGKEIIYKEIFGMIFGYYNLSEQLDIMPLDRYILSRKDSFSKEDCETIYQIALDYKKVMEKNNLVDNNFASRRLINEVEDFEYSLSIIDEVQDYTQVNLCLFKKLSLKLFCVGDALQMINPSYFDFGYLKNLLFEKDLTEIKELKNNYRNTAKIVEIIDALSEINKAEFGTHNFVLKGQSVDSGLKTTAIFVKDYDFINRVANSKFDNFTFVVANHKQKQELRKHIKNQEILTVSEIKGLERNTVVVFNVLTENADKWKKLEHRKINHKQADENSVFRYYYNLFYVGLSRAKQNIFVVENTKINQFEEFFKNNFMLQDSKTAIRNLGQLVSKVEFTQTEVLERIAEFIKLGQYDNARFTAEKILDSKKRIENIRTIEIHENLISKGKYREAGIKFWEYGLTSEAKKQFILSGDTMLIELVNSCTKNNSTNLNIDIVDYFDDVIGNDVATNFILQVVKKDLTELKDSLNTIKSNFRKGDINGK